MAASAPASHLTAEDRESEASLVRLTQQGDGDAFQQLLRAHLPRIHQYASRMLDNPTEANDIAQDVFVRFWRKSNSFDPNKAKLTTWLHQIAHNLCMDYFRKHGRMTHLEDHHLSGHRLDENELDDHHEGAGNSLESELQNAQEQRRIKHLINALPERQRSALVLCHYQGHSHKETAIILGVSTDAVESLIARARRSLKQNLLEYSHEPGQV